jgi:hypothetical protein
LRLIINVAMISHKTPGVYMHITRDPIKTNQLIVRLDSVRHSKAQADINNRGERYIMSGVALLAIKITQGVVAKSNVPASAITFPNHMRRTMYKLTKNTKANKTVAERIQNAP